MRGRYAVRILNITQCYYPQAWIVFDIPEWSFVPYSRFLSSISLRLATLEIIEIISANLPALRMVISVVPLRSGRVKPRPPKTITRTPEAGEWLASDEASTRGAKLISVGRDESDRRA
jgi:hypothetical protein